LLVKAVLVCRTVEFFFLPFGDASSSFLMIAPLDFGN